MSKQLRVHYDDKFQFPASETGNFMDVSSMIFINYYYFFIVRMRIHMKSCVRNFAFQRTRMRRRGNTPTNNSSLRVGSIDGWKNSLGTIFLGEKKPLSYKFSAYFIEGKSFQIKKSSVKVFFHGRIGYHTNQSPERVSKRLSRYTCRNPTRICWLVDIQSPN
jgi:hypothetical protein